MHRSKLRHTRENIRCKREVGQFDLDLKPKFTTKYTFSHNLPNPITFFLRKQSSVCSTLKTEKKSRAP